MSIGNFAPKGSMCVKCVDSKANCDQLPFHKMKVVERCNVSLYKIVICTEYRQKEKL